MNAKTYSISGITLLALLMLALLGLSAARNLSARSEETSAAPKLAYDATGAMLEAVVYPQDPQGNPVLHAAYDAADVRERAITTQSEVDMAAARIGYPVYDATGAMLRAITPPEAVPAAVVAPVYDATGAMLKAITQPEATPAAVVAPVYDATGAMLAAVVFPETADGQLRIAAKGSEPSASLPIAGSLEQISTLPWLILGAALFVLLAGGWIILRRKSVHLS